MTRSHRFNDPAHLVAHLQWCCEEEEYRGPRPSNIAYPRYRNLRWAWLEAVVLTNKVMGDAVLAAYALGHEVAALELLAKVDDAETEERGIM